MIIKSCSLSLETEVRARWLEIQKKERKQKQAKFVDTFFCFFVWFGKVFPNHQPSHTNFVLLLLIIYPVLSLPSFVLPCILEDLAWAWDLFFSTWNFYLTWLFMFLSNPHRTSWIPYKDTSAESFLLLFVCQHSFLKRKIMARLEVGSFFFFETKLNCILKIWNPFAWPRESILACRWSCNCKTLASCFLIISANRIRIMYARANILFHLSPLGASNKALYKAISSSCWMKRRRPPPPPSQKEVRN